MMVKLRKDTKAIPFPRRVSTYERERFWRKLLEEVTSCGEIMPNTSTFYREFSDVTYDSFADAVKHFWIFRNRICRGERTC